MAEVAESILLSKIARIQNYVNSRGLSLSQILRETGADAAINTIMYNPDGSPCSHLKVNGNTIGKSPYTAWGLAWDEGPDIHVVKLPNIPGGDQDLKERNYVGGAKLILNGTPDPHPIYDDAQGGVRGRTAIGMKPGKLCLYCSSDGSSATLPESLRDRLHGYGWNYASMQDCGGSCQCRVNGREIKSARKVRYLMLVYLKKDDPPSVSPSGYDPVVKAYSMSKDGNKLLSDHFRVREFGCADGSDPVFVSPALVQILEAIRQHFGPVVINSGYRTPGHNKRVGGKPQSQHLYGLAADIRISGVSPDAVADYARKLMPHHGGVGRYRTFTHVDVRKIRSDWRG